MNNMTQKKIKFYLIFENSQLEEDKQLYLTIKGEPNKDFELKKSQNSSHIYEVQIESSELQINKKNKYFYKIYSNELYQSVILVNPMQKQNSQNDIIEIFDAPLEFKLEGNSKSPIKLQNKLEILNFLNQNTSISSMLNLQYQLEQQKENQKLKDFFNESSKIVQVQLEREDYVKDSFQQYVKYTELLCKQKIINVEIINQLSNNYSKYSPQINNKQEVETQLKNIYKQVIKPEDRFKVLEKQQIFSEEEAINYIKDYENNKWNYINLFSKMQDTLVYFSNTKYVQQIKNLRGLLIKEKIEQSNLKDLEQINFDGITEDEKKQFKDKILNSDFKDKTLMQVFQALEKIKDALKISFCQMRQFVKKMLDQQKDEPIEEEIIKNYLLKYKININTCFSSLKHFLQNLQDQDKENEFLELIIIQNPFIQAEQILNQFKEKAIKHRDYNLLFYIKNFLKKQFNFQISQLLQEEEKKSKMEGEEIYEYNDYINDIKQILLNEEIINQFNFNLKQEIKQIMSRDGLKNICDILIFNQIDQENQQEFNNYLQEQINNYQNELQNQQEVDNFLKDLEEFTKMSINNKIPEYTNMILVKFENIANQRLQKLIKNQDELFNSDFVERYIKVNKKDVKFSQILKNQVDQIVNKINEFDYCFQEFQRYKNMKYLKNLLQFYELKSDLIQTVDQDIQNIKEHLEILKNFSNKFNKYLPFLQEYSQQYDFHKQKISIIKQTIENKINYSIFAVKFWQFQKPKIAQNIFQKLQEQNELELDKKISKSKQENYESIRMQYLNQLINQFILELSVLYNSVFEKKQQQIKALTEFQQTFQKTIINVNKTDSVNATLFNKDTSFEDLLQYCEIDQMHINLTELCKLLGKQEVAQNKLNEIKRWSIIIKFQCNDILILIAEILKIDKTSSKNKQLFDFIDYYQKKSEQNNYNWIQKTPIHILLEEQLHQEVKNAYDELQKLSNVHDNLSFYKQSQFLIKKIGESRNQQFSLFDLRYFIGKDQHDLSVYLSSLNKFVPFLDQISYMNLQNQNIIQGLNNQQYIIQDIKNLNNLINKELPKYGSLNEWKELTENDFKLEQIQIGSNEKQQYLKFLQNFCITGQIQISTPLSNKYSKFNFICNDQVFDELKIKELKSRVLIEKNSKTYISQQNKLDNNLNEESNQLKIEKYLKQLDIVQDISQKLQELFEYGYFLFDRDIYEYKNQNNKYQQNIITMKEDLVKLENQLKQWKIKIQETIEKYPKFSLISYSHYPQLHQYLKRQDGQILSKSLQQISFQIDFKNLQNVTDQIKNEYSQSQEKLEFIADFVTLGKKKLINGGMEREYPNKIIMCQFKDSEQAIDKILLYEQNIENFKSEYFYFFDKHSKLQDLEIFLYRYKYLENDDSVNFYLIITHKLKYSEQRMLIDIKNSKNSLIILIQQDCYDSSFPQFKINEIQGDFQANKILNHFKQCAVFYVSSFHGVGKTTQINQDIQVQKKNGKVLIRLPINGKNKKQALIQQLQQNISEKLTNINGSQNKQEQMQQLQQNIQEKNFFHIDVYESEEIDINFLLFEMIFLKTINFNQKEYINLGSRSVFYIEISNSIFKSLENKIKIKKHFEIKEITFDINKLDIDILKSNDLEKQTLEAYRYLYGLQEQQEQQQQQAQQEQNQKDNNQVLKKFLKLFKPEQLKKYEIYFDNKQNLLNLEKIKSVESSKFKDLINQFYIKYLQEQKIVPNFQQVVNFISIFGNEMMRFNKCEYVSLQQTQELQNNLRTDIVKLSFQMCQKISMSCLQDDKIYKISHQNNLNIEEIQSKIADNLFQFNKLLTNFVTFQEQEIPCLTSFFVEEKDIPKSILNLYNQYKNKLLVFDNKDNKSDDYKNWLITLFNQNVETFYQNIDKKLSQNIQNYVKKLVIQKDNFFKISAIYLRIRSNIPVILMGDTGIGKTALIYFLTYVMNAIFKHKTIHSGVTEEDIIDMIKSSENEIEQLKDDKKIILFFDEVNTSDHVGGIFKEIIVDRSIKGKKISKNIIPIAAINPYQLKTKKQKQIIDYLIQGISKKDTLKKFQSSDFEYNVFPIPLSMLSFIFNFGGLEEIDESRYIENMIQDTFIELNQSVRQLDSSLKKSLVSMINLSQKFVRQSMGERKSACSLRNVKRYFDFLKLAIEITKQALKTKEYKMDVSSKNIVKYSAYLAFYINYSLMIPKKQHRDEYLKKLCEIENQSQTQEINKFIEKIEDFFISQLDIADNIVKNFCFKQNVLLFFFCIVNKTPVCLIGPPGSSKTLSLKCLIQSMQGSQSKMEFLKQYPALIPIYFQGHSQTKSEKITELFQDAEKRQENLDIKNQISQDKNLAVICFEEIGLAEISPDNPLKVLHEQLEKNKVAFVSISNWPLDASKMNRMISIYRLDMDQNELENFYEDFINQTIKKDKNKLQKYKILVQNKTKIPQLYKNFIENQKKEQLEPKHQVIHGIRDYFSIIKQIKRQIDQNSDQDEGSIIQQAFFRNLSGLKNSKDVLQNLLKDFKGKLQFQPLELIKQNLNEKCEFTSRNLMIITNQEQKAFLFLKQQLKDKKHKFFSGMNFLQEEQDEQYNNFTINKIIGCIEEGYIIILQNLESIYQSFYEILNQSYFDYNNKKYSKVYIGADQCLVEVNKNFKFILIVNEQQLSMMDGPLLNRFEKHFLNDQDIIDEQDKSFIKTIEDQINRLQQDKKQLIQKQYKNLTEVQLDQSPFKFKNVESFIQDLYLLCKFESLNNSIPFENNQKNQEIILNKLFHLSNFQNLIVPVNENSGEKEMMNKLHKAYIDSGYHFSLQSFITNRIDMKLINNCDQIEKFVIFTPIGSIFEKKINNHQYIDLNEIESYQQFNSQIKKFLSQTLKPEVRNQTENNLKIDIQLLEKSESQQKILIINTYLSSKNSKTKQNILNVISNIDEQIAQIGQQNFQKNIYLNIIIIINVEEHFEIIPIESKWEYYYIEDLDPFKKYESTVENFILLRDIKKNLCLKNLIQNQYLRINQLFNLRALIDFFLNYDFQIIQEAYSKIKYDNNQNLNQYKMQRLQQLTKAFQNNLLLGNLKQNIETNFYKIMEQIYKVQTFNDFMFNYLIPNQFIDKSNILINSIILGLRHIFVQFILMAIYSLEKDGLIYGISNCEEEEFTQYVNIQIDKFMNQSNNFLKASSETLALSNQNDFIIPENQIVLQILQNFESQVKQYQEKQNDNNQQIFEKLAYSAEEKFSGNLKFIKKFPNLILQDSKNKQINYIKEEYTYIIKTILRINSKSQVEQQQYLISIYLVWYIWRQQIEVIYQTISNFKQLFSLEEILQKCEISNQSQIQESIEQLCEKLIEQIHISIKSKSTQHGILILYKMFEDSIYQLQNILSKSKNIQYNKILENVQLINHICSNFQEIYEVEKLVSQINEQDLIKLDQQSLKDVESLLKNKLSTNQIKKNFQMKWGQLMQKLIMISIQNGYTKQIEPKFIHLIFELEKNQALVDNNMVKNTQFQLFLHRVFFLLSNNLTIENQLESFNNSSESFKENILQRKQQFYTFLAYGQILQNKLFKNVQLDKIFFDILLQKDFNQLNVLQQTIYLSIFKAFVENIVGESNFNQMMSPQKQSRIQHALQNQEKKDDNLDEKIQNYFCNLTEQAFQLFIVKQLFYKQKLKDLPKLQYLNNCQWLKQYAMLSENKIEECINLKRYDLTEEQNEVQDLLQTVQSNIQSSNNIFKNMYQGVINNNQYYPFNMKYSIESEIDLINTNTLDESKNLYECLRCNNLIVFNQQEAYKDIPRCNYCQVDINLNEKNKLKLIQENLSNKESLLSKINIKTGFCLHLSEKKFYEHENFDIKYFCKYLFGLVYFCVLDLSLEQQNSPYNKKQIVNLKNTSNGNLEQNETLLINKILQLGPQIQAKDYLKKQIQLALNNYYKFTDKVLSITQKQSLYILHDMIKYLLSLDLVQAVDIKNSESINQKISDSCQAQLQNLREKYCNKLFQVLELQQIVDYQIDDQPTLLYKSLKYASKYVDNKIAYQKIKDKIIREDIQKNYPILDFLLEVQNNKYSECLKIFIQFYHKQFNLYQFKYQYSKIQNLTLKQEFNQKQDQLYEFQIVTFKYNELIEQIKSETQNESNKEIQDLGKMSEEALFIDFLFTQKNKPTKFFTILKYLCEYQNQLIEQLLSLCQKNNSNSNVKRLYQELKIQLFNKQNEKECKPLQNISSFQIINANSDINLEQFSSLGFEEGDGINFNVIFDLENLQYELCRTIFNNACLIDIKQTAQIKFLNSPEQIVKMPLYQSKFQELSPCVIRHLDQIIKNKDHAFEILQKITTAQNLINFELESPDNSILSAMESLRLKFEPQKLSEVLGQIKLKDIKGFTTYIQDQVLDKLIQHCKKNFQNNCNLQNIEKIIQTFTQNQAQLKELRKIIGRFIIKMSSQEKLLDHQEKSLIQLLEEEEIIQKDHPILAQENLKTLKIQDCFVLFERCQSQINNLESQEVSNQNENSQRLLIEDFKDE